MPKVVVSIDGAVIREEHLSRERTTVGRRPYNDIVIDNLAVSGEHAALVMAPEGVRLEDCNSTNGTLLNGKRVTRQLLQDHDTIEIGKYRIRYFAQTHDDAFEKTMVVKPPTVVQRPPPPAPAPAPAGATTLIRVLSGPAAGHEVPLVKPVTTVGKTGAAIAAITRQPDGCVVAAVAGPDAMRLNGALLGKVPVALSDGDILELAGARLQFVRD